MDRGSIIYGNASSVTTVLGQGNADEVLTSDGTDIAWAAAGGGGISHDGSTADGVLTYKDADEATVEANLTFDGTDLTVAGDIIIGNDGTIGSVGDPDAIAIASNGQVTISSGHEATFSSMANMVGGIGVGGSELNSRFTRSSIGSGSTTLYIGNQTVTTSSDIRIKENIVDTEVDALSKLKDLRVVDFTWNDPSDICFNNRNVRGKWTGLIAQEVIEHIPYVVNAVRDEETLEPIPDSKQFDIDGNEMEEDSLWGLEYDKLVPVLVKAVQELSAKVEALENA